MAAMERITMTMRELDRYKVIQDVADGVLRPTRSPLIADSHRRFNKPTRKKEQNAKVDNPLKSSGTI
jgi:hypothetical protein